jgi:hypothetical protein
MEKSRLDVNMEDGLKAAAEGTVSGNYLGDARLVEQMVRDFMSTVLSERSKWHETADGTAAEARINELCASYGQVFLGNSTADVAQPWNSLYRLGAYLRAALSDPGKFDNPVEAYFQHLAVQALNAAIDLEEGANEEHVKSQLTEIVEDAVDILLGSKAGQHQ